MARKTNIDLHSTIFKLIRTDDTITYTTPIYLHSTIFKLIRTKMPIVIPIKYKFTFYYI